MVRWERRRNLSNAMNQNKSSSDAPATAAISALASSAPQLPAAASGKAHRVIKLGVDVHWREYVVVRQVDGTAPQPAQRFTPDAFIAWVAKQVAQADVVHCCYEAGPFGFVLHRRVVALGVKNLVVRPRNWDQYGQKVKTDRRDALALVSCLDRYVAGNTEALTSIRIPTEAEERARSLTRQRDQLLEHRKRCAAQGLSCARFYGYDLPEEWWRAKRFAALSKEIPEFLLTLLASAHNELEVARGLLSDLDAEPEVFRGLLWSLVQDALQERAKVALRCARRRMPRHSKLLGCCSPRRRNQHTCSKKSSQSWHPPKVCLIRSVTSRKRRARHLRQRSPCRSSRISKAAYFQL